MGGKPEVRVELKAMDWLSGGGEMGALMRTINWANTSFGPVSAWPESLRTAISIMLASRFAMVVAWGPEFRFFYNDRYRPVLGASKHPGALGAPARLIFPEAWPFIGPLFESTLQGEAVALDDVLIPLDRYGYLENCYFTLSYSPIRNELGQIGGMLAVVAETTERVQSERRLRTLRDLARRASEAKTAEAACLNAAITLAANTIDVPFALFYLLDQAGQNARLVAAIGLAQDAKASPNMVDLSDLGRQDGWPLGEITLSRQIGVLGDLPARFGPLPGGPYPEQTHMAVLVPLVRSGQPHPDGILVFGVSPRRALDEAYRGFYELAADHILSAVRNARAYEEERKRAEALAELDRAKTAFFGNVSHEFRTPLTLMLGPLEEVLNKTNTSLALRDRAQLEMVYRNGLRLLKLVNTLLDFSRLEAGRVQAVYEPVDLAAYTADLASVFRSAIERAGLRLIINCPPLPEPIYVDREMWEKIVLNLISNAFKFTFEGEIAVELVWAGDQVALEVRDTGIGIPETELPHLFERFHRILGARARTHEGSGIGLALVQELVLFHGGQVSARSVYAQGSIFTVSIPAGCTHLPADRIGAARTLQSTSPGAAPYLEEALRWLPQEPDISQLWLETEKLQSVAQTGGPEVDGSQPADKSAYLLLVDDNADMRHYIVRLLRQHWQVEAVADGFTALKAARERLPDLVLADVMMPGLDGFELLRELRADPHTREIIIILLSARAGEESQVEGLEAGADDYLIKPFSARELIIRVGTHLKLKRLREEARRENEAQLRALNQTLEQRVEERTAALARSLKELDQFTYIASHDLKAPLRTLNYLATWIAEDAAAVLPEASKVHLAKLQSRIKRMEKLLNDLLTYARLGRSYHQNIESIDTGVLLKEIIDLLTPPPGFTITVQEKMPVLMTHQLLLELVFKNLIENAMKHHHRPDGRVSISARELDNFIEFSVTDDGPGIDEVFHERIFQIFQTLQPHNLAESTGVGLAIVKKTVESQGGTIQVISTRGQGTTFRFTWPKTLIT